MATARTTKKVVQAPEGVTILDSGFVALNAVKGYRNNPRVGDIDAMMESLKENGQYRRALVNIGTKTGRPNEILAGNHMWLALRKMDAEGIAIDYCDVDEDAARKIVLADNKLALMGTFDNTVLRDLLAEVPDANFVGTGYNELDFEDLTTKLTQGVDETMSRMEQERKAQAEADAMVARSKTFDGAPLGEEPDPDSEEAREADREWQETYEQALAEGEKDIKENLVHAPERLDGALQLGDPREMVFPAVGPWDLPTLDPDKIMRFDELPLNLETWAGSASKDDPDDGRWYLYAWGIDSTSGMKDISKVILSFYCFDEYFENWWSYPNRYVAKLLNSKIKYAVTPDWSMDPMQSHAHSLWMLYRNRWLGRYLQEVGMRVIPNVSWRDGEPDFLREYVLDTLPVGLEMIAIQMQTIDEENVIGGLDMYRRCIQMCFDVLKPKGALIYAGPQGREVMKSINTGKTQIRMLSTRLEKLGAFQAAKSRGKKKYNLMSTFNNYERTWDYLHDDGTQPHVVILGAPYDLGSIMPGQRAAPYEIRRAGNWAPDEMYSFHHDRYVTTSVVDAGDVPIYPDPEESQLAIQVEVRAAVRCTQRLTVVLGGDNSISLHAIKGMVDATTTKPYVVLLDAHSDLWAEDDSEVRNHSTWLRDAFDDDCIAGAAIYGERTLGPTRDVWNHYPVTWVSTVNELIELAQKQQDIYLAVDIDVADPSCAPGVAVPEPGGMNPRDLLALVYRIVDETNVRVMDVTEVLPSADIACLTTLLANRVVVTAMLASSDRTR